MSYVIILGCSVHYHTAPFLWACGEGEHHCGEDMVGQNLTSWHPGERTKGPESYILPKNDVFSIHFLPVSLLPMFLSPLNSSHNYERIN